MVSKISLCLPHVHPCYLHLKKEKTVHLKKKEKKTEKRDPEGYILQVQPRSCISLFCWKTKMNLLSKFYCFLDNLNAELENKYLFSTPLSVGLYA